MWNLNKPSVKEVSKAQQKELKLTSRDIERDVANLDREMAKLEVEIRGASNRGDDAGARILARQLVKMREQKQRMLKVNNQVASSRYASAATQATMNQAMYKTTTAMDTMNKQMNVSSMQKMSTAYETESGKAALKMEMMDEVYDSVFEGNEEEESDIMNQIYDEIGLECSDAAPSAPAKLSETTDEQVDEFIRSQRSANKE